MADVILAEVMPELAEEISAFLQRKDRLDLAGQISALRIVDRCRCEDAFCSTILTAAPPEIPRTGGLDESIAIGSAEGIVVVDVTDGVIDTVEILFRPDLRPRVRELFP